jgi:hypothetical protein
MYSNSDEAARKTGSSVAFVFFPQDRACSSRFEVPGHGSPKTAFILAFLPERLLLVSSPTSNSIHPNNLLRPTMDHGHLHLFATSCSVVIISVDLLYTFVVRITNSSLPVLLGYQ